MRAATVVLLAALALVCLHARAARAQDAAPDAAAAPAAPVTAADAGQPSATPTPEPRSEASPAAPIPPAAPAADSNVARDSGAKRRLAASRKEPAAAATANSPLAGLSFGASHGPINVKSDTMTLDQQDQSVLFSGHVRAVQSASELTSNTLKVVFANSSFHDVSEMTADGDVRITQGTRWATGDHAILDQTKHTVVLTGNPVVHDGTDQIAGTRITVYLDNGKSVVEGARAVIFPRRSENADNDNSVDHAR